MCDGYIPFARAFVKGDIDTTGYEVAYSAYENADSEALCVQTPSEAYQTMGKRLIGRIRRLKRR